MRRLFKPISAGVLVAALAGGLASCSSGYGNRIRVPFHQTIPVTAPTSFTLDNTAGTVRVVGWNKPSIDISGVKTAGDQQSADAMTIAVRHTGNAVSVSTQYARGAHNGGTTYVIHLPADSPIDVTNVAGTLTIEYMASDVKTSVSAGTTDVTMARLTGKQRVTIDGTTGTVSLRIPRKSDATIDAHQTVGSVRTEVPNVVGKGTAAVSVSATIGTISIGWTS